MQNYQGRFKENFSTEIRKKIKKTLACLKLPRYSNFKPLAVDTGREQPVILQSKSK